MTRVFKFISFSPPGPSGLVQQCRPAGAAVPKPPLVISDSDSEEEEGLVSRLMPASCLQQAASCTEGVSTTQNTASSHNSVFDELTIAFTFGCGRRLGSVTQQLQYGGICESKHSGLSRCVKPVCGHTQICSRKLQKVQKQT